MNADVRYIYFSIIKWKESWAERPVIEPEHYFGGKVYKYICQRHYRIRDVLLYNE